MNILAIFGVQLVLSLFVYALIAKWYVSPWLAEKPLNQALMLLIFPHAIRHLGLAFLVPGVVAETLPREFANAVAYGDFASGLLAILCLLALRVKWSLALLLVWLFNIVGTADLLKALSNADGVPHLAAAWFIPTFWVPVLLVTHYMVFARLLKHRALKL